MHSEEVEVEVKKRSKDWKRNRISWKRQRKNPEKETSIEEMEKEQKVKISFNEKAVYVFVCWQARKK